MSARTIIAAPVIWFGSWLWLLIGLLRMRISWRGLRWSGLGNKKGPEEAPCAPPAFGMASATRGDAPGYDDDKEFGNNIAHLPAQASQRLREHSHPAPNVKAMAHSARLLAA